MKVNKLKKISLVFILENAGKFLEALSKIKTLSILNLRKCAFYNSDIALIKFILDSNGPLILRQLNLSGCNLQDEKSI